MLTRYLNLYMVMIGIILNGIILWRIDEILKYFPYKIPRINKLFWINMVYLMSVGLETIYIGKPGSSVFIMMNVVNFLQYLCLYLLSAFVTCYVGYHIKKNGLLRIDMRPFLCIYGIVIFLLFINLWNHMYYYIGQDNTYYRGKYFLLSQILGLLCHAILLGFYIRCGKYMDKLGHMLISSYCIIPMLGSVFQIISGGINCMVISIILCCLILVAEGYYMWVSRFLHRKQQLEQMVVSMKFGRMYPDFAYNTLADISQLCKVDPPKASEIIDIFADFLRKCMNDISEVKLNPFSEEFDHMENYLKLEEMRFGDDLEVNYEIEEEDFYIPSQILQRTAECMIRYVMAQSEDIFSLMVHSYRREKGYVIEFYDENFGAKHKERKQSEEELLEIEDIRTRLQIVPEAYLEYISNQEMGTMFRIYL